MQNETDTACMDTLVLTRMKGNFIVEIFVKFFIVYMSLNLSSILH
jgi:hypothetical protein